MSESFDDNPPRIPSQSEKSKIPPESNLSEEDKMMNREIDNIGDDYYRSKNAEIEKDYKEEVEKIKNTRDRAERISAYIDAYIGKHPNKANKKMSLNDFTDIVNNESDFNTSIRDLINKWLDEHEGKINLEKSLGFFLSSVLEEWMECRKLLEPGPEENKGDEIIDKEIGIIGQEIIDSAKKMMNEIVGYIYDHQDVNIESMLFSDFLEKIKEIDSGFNPEITKQINRWIENHPELINKKMSVDDFLVAVFNRVKEYE